MVTTFLFTKLPMLLYCKAINYLNNYPYLKLFILIILPFLLNIVIRYAFFDFEVAFAQPDEDDSATLVQSLSDSETLVDSYDLSYNN